MLVRWLGSDGTLATAYILAACACATAGAREVAVRDRRRRSWPAFWFTCSAVLVAVGIARAAKLGGMISKAGKARARAEGWYAGRHHVQVLALAALALVWLLMVALALWRTRPSHRHCLPAAVVVVSLLSFLVVRLVSLHQVDRVLDHKVHGAEPGSLIELAGCLLVVLVAVVTSVRPGAREEGGQVIPGAPGAHGKV